MTISGIRVIRSRLRLAITQESWTDWMRPPRGLAAPPCGTATSVTRAHAARPPQSSSALGVVAGQRDEHVVEGRAAQPDVVDLDAAVVQLADDLGEQLGATRRPAR